MNNLDPDYDYLIEDGKVICKTKKVTIGGKSIDLADFSWRVKRKYDKIDNDKQLVLESHPFNMLGKEKQKKERSHIKTKDIGRYGFEG